MNGSPVSAPSKRSPLVGAVAGAACAVSLLAFASPASAAFTTAKCAGGQIAGQGASFAASAHNQVWIPTALPAFCLNEGSAPTVTYNSTGSGSGRRVMGERSNGSPEGDNTTGARSRIQAPRFGMTEEPPAPTGQSQINQGTDAQGDEAQMRLIPAALGAVAVPINIPDGCRVDLLPNSTTQANDAILSNSANTTNSSGASTNNNGADTRRLKLTREQLERAFNGDGNFDQWGELVPTINDGNGTDNEASDTRCRNFPLVRVRRLDDGGSTFVFKDFLDKLNPSRGWRTTFVSPDTRTWPNSSRTTAFDYNNDGDTSDDVAACSAQFAPFNSGTTSTCNENAVPLLQTTAVAAPGGNGNDDLVNQVNDRDGSIGYGDLSTARQQRSFAFERQAGNDDKYWVQLQVGNAGSSTFADPQSAPEGFRSGGARGSNCSLATLRDVPGGNDPTLANWEAVTAVDSPQGYGACSLTYFIAFDDYSGPYSAEADQAAEERKARTIRDYIEAVSTAGQNGLSSFDYSSLPPSVQELSENAAKQIGWAKTAGGGGGGGNQTLPPAPTPGPGGGPGGTTLPPGGGRPPVVVVSNAFTISSARASKGNVILSLQIPGGGSVRAVAKSRIKRKTRTVASAASSRTSGGAVKLTLRPSRIAKREIRRRGRLRVSLVVTFAPTGGSEASQSRTVTVKGKKKKSRRKKSSSNSR